MREISDLADGKRGKGGIILEVILTGDPVLAAEVVVDIPVDLIGNKSCVGSHNERVVAELLLSYGICEVFRRNDELPVGELEVHDVQRDLAQIGGHNTWVGIRGGSAHRIERSVCQSRETRGIAVRIGESRQGWHFGERTILIDSPLALIGPEEKQFVFPNWPTERHTKRIAFQIGNRTAAGGTLGIP